MADFATFLPLVLANEGGWSDNPHDPGGATNRGITARTFAAVADRLPPHRTHVRQSPRAHRRTGRRDLQG